DAQYVPFCDRFLSKILSFFLFEQQIRVRDDVLYLRSTDWEAVPRQDQEFGPRVTSETNGHDSPFLLKSGSHQPPG
ncbi:MAG: hypothetical protein U9Q78_07500, partial [Chloroflexota bacterium]|nr:hypothetical protein [Chloroflexota bacterium]